MEKKIVIALILLNIIGIICFLQRFIPDYMESRQGVIIIQAPEISCERR